MSRSKFIFSIVFIVLFFVSVFAISPPKGTKDHYVKARSVKVFNDKGVCSGVQVKAPSGKNIILSASHCLNLMDKDLNFTVITEDGKTYTVKFIAESSVSDLIAMEGVPGLEGLSIAKAIEMDEHVRTFTHGEDLPTYRTEGALISETIITLPMFSITNMDAMKVCSSMSKFSLQIEPLAGPVCFMSVTVSVSTALVVPGSSGGMVIDDSNELVGIVSATNGKGFSYFCTLKDIISFTVSF